MKASFRRVSLPLVNASFLRVQRVLLPVRQEAQREDRGQGSAHGHAQPGDQPHFQRGGPTPADPEDRYDSEPATICLTIIKVEPLYALLLLKYSNYIPYCY